MKKKCQHCKEEKSLGEFFSPPFDAKTSWVGTSLFCKQCHADGLIPFGYGDPVFEGRYNSPEDV